jgi:hypothetical protein
MRASEQSGSGSDRISAQAPEKASDYLGYALHNFSPMETATPFPTRILFIPRQL